MGKRYLSKLTPVTLETAEANQREMLESAQKQMGFIPNMYANMANVPAVLDTYTHGYNLFRKHSGLSPTEQEVVLLAISQVNGCHYCTAAHSMIADKVSGVPAEVLDAIRNGKEIPDERLAALFAFTQSLVRNLGQPEPERFQAFIKAGFTEKHALNIILAISVKVLSNYTNHAFDTEVDEQFSAYKV